MARSDLLLNLVRAGTRGERELFKKTIEALVAEERAKNHKILADQLEESIKEPANAPGNGFPLRSLDDRIHNLLYEVAPRNKLADLILPRPVLAACTELVEEHNRRDLLRSYNLEPRHRVLLEGPPGNGKTSLAHALADATTLPLYVARYEGLIGSYLGETASRLRTLFDYVRMRPCALFFDEFDTLGKERGDIHDTGEIKRVVSSLLLQIDDLPSHVLVITATNHHELLDRAVWRRFQIRLRLPAPSCHQAEEMLKRFEKHFGKPLGYSPRALSSKLKGMSFSEIEEFTLDIMRQYTLQLPQGNLQQVVSGRVKQWQDRARPRAAH